MNTWITDIRARQTSGREAVIIRLHRLGWTQEKISTRMGLTQNRVSQIINNAIYGNIDNLLTQGLDMKYIADHYNMELALAWALRLQRVYNTPQKIKKSWLSDKNSQPQSNF